MFAHTVGVQLANYIPALRSALSDGAAAVAWAFVAPAQVEVLVDVAVAAAAEAATGAPLVAANELAVVPVAPESKLVSHTMRTVPLLEAATAAAIEVGAGAAGLQAALAAATTSERVVVAVMATEEEGAAASGLLFPRAVPIGWLDDLRVVQKMRNSQEVPPAAPCNTSGLRTCARSSPQRVQRCSSSADSHRSSAGVGRPASLGSREQ